MQTVWDSLGVVYNSIPQLFPRKVVEIPVEVTKVIEKEAQCIMVPKMFVRVAGFSGAIAVSLAAYGAHGLSDADPKRKMIFETGSRFHLIHSIALLATPMCGRPYLVGTLMTAGMIGFCGSCYVQGLTGDTRIRRITPYGGILLILAWIAMVL